MKDERYHQGNSLWTKALSQLSLWRYRGILRWNRLQRRSLTCAHTHKHEHANGSRAFDISKPPPSPPEVHFTHSPCVYFPTAEDDRKKKRKKIPWKKKKLYVGQPLLQLVSWLFRNYISFATSKKKEQSMLQIVKFVRPGGQIYPLMWLKTSRMCLKRAVAYVPSTTHMLI